MKKKWVSSQFMRIRLQQAQQYCDIHTLLFKIKNMKNTLLTLLLTLCVVGAWAQKHSTLAKPRVINHPVIEYCPHWIAMNDIELTQEATIIRGYLHNHPNYTCSVADNAFLKDRHSDKQFKVLRAEGIQLNEQVAMPESGRVPFTLYFEPLDADVKELNFIEPAARPTSGVYGIQLQTQPKASPKSKVFDPRQLTSEYYLRQRVKPDTQWRFDNQRYKQAFSAPFRSGKAVLTVYLDNLPMELFAAMEVASLRVKNQMTKEQQNVTAQLDTTSRSLTFHLDLPHPQWVGGFHSGNIFIQPGDTLEVFSSFVTDQYRKPLYTTFRSSSESAMINTLTPYFMQEYTPDGYDYTAVSQAITAGKDSVMRVVEKFRDQAIGLLGNETLRQDLIRTPLSTFGKDVVMMSMVTRQIQYLEDVLLYYKDEQYKRTQKEDGTQVLEPNSAYQPLDDQAVYGALMPYKQLIYDNPLALCEASQWVFVNRTIYGDLARQYEKVKNASGDWEFVRKDQFGMDGTFMSDLERSQDISSILNSTTESLTLGQEEDTEKVLNIVAMDVASTIQSISSLQVAHAVLNKYRHFVQATEGQTAGEDSHWTAEQRALWKRLFGKYEGNLLLIDFWGLGCGPCRSGMLSMRNNVEAMKGEPFKFIYLSATDGEILTAKSEEWMNQNQIKGEHLFVSQSEWAMLESMLSFSSIPRYVLCGPDGRLIQNNISIYNYDVEKMKAMVKKLVPQR